MEKRVLIDTWQKVTRDDFLKFGTFPRDSFDTVVGKVLIPDMAYSGFAVVQSGAAEVTVANGHLLNLGKVYVNDSEGGTTVDLLSRLPAATKRMVAITVWGTETDAKLEARTFLTDAETRATVARETATERWRWANIGPVSGVEGPDPGPPTLAADVCPVAWVTLSTTGIELIERATDFLVPTLREADNRLNEIDIWRLIIGTRLDTLAADLLALAARIAGLAKWNLVRMIANDLARLKDAARADDAWTSYAVDHFLTADESDIGHVDYLARIEEGIRFPPAAGFDAQFGLLNIYDAAVINTNNVLLPKWTATARISNLGTDTELSISQYQYQTVDWTQKTMTRQITRYGTPFAMCTNVQWWQEGSYDWASGIFRRGSETFQLIGQEATTAADYFNIPNHIYVRLQQVWTDNITVPYWDRVVVDHSISGSLIAETFVNSQDGWLCEIDLYFSRVAASGDVTLLLCECTNSMPDVSKVLASSTVTQANLKVSPAGETARIPTPFLFNPVFLQKNRYALVVVTVGNHYVWTLQDKNYVSGTLFYSTDGDWFMGDLTKDLSFAAYFCKFENNMTRAQLQALTLSGGIAAIDINADAIIPDGCQLYYEIQKDGVWHMLDAVDGGPSAILNGLPPLLPFRVVFVGTELLQPALGVAANSRVTTWRPRSDFRHISAARTFPSSTTIQADVRLENWRGAPYHTFAGKLLHGASFATVRIPDTESTEVPQDDPNAIIYHFTWTGMGAMTTCKFRFEGTTDNVLTTYHIAERFDIEP